MSQLDALTLLALTLGESLMRHSRRMKAQPAPLLIHRTQALEDK